MCLLYVFEEMRNLQTCDIYFGAELSICKFRTSNFSNIPKLGNLDKNYVLNEISAPLTLWSISLSLRN